MPRKKKAEKEGLMHHFCAEFMTRAEELLAAHEDEIAAILEDSEDNKVGVTFNLLIDASESQPKMTVRIRFSEVHTDERVVQMDDPNQGTFSAIVEVAKKRKSKTGDDAEGDE